MPIRSTFLISIVLLHSHWAVAQLTDSSGYSMISFDTLASRLPANLLGHNAKELYWSMEAKIGRSYKDEFETTEENKKRTRDEFSKPIVGMLDIRSVYAFRIYPLRTTYDADNGILTIRCPLSQTSSKRIPYFKSVSWMSEWKDKGSYIGTNAFGATIEVSSSTTIGYDIALANFSDFPLEAEEQSSLFQWFYQIKLTLPPAEARKAKLSVAALVIGDMVQPFTSSDFTHLPATFDSPLQLTLITFNFHINVFQIWFFDVETGTILATIRRK